jgi:hypothetical protein
MARKRVTAKVTAKKKAPVPSVIPTIDVDVDLGTLNATEHEKERLRAHLESTLLTWVKYDVKEQHYERPVIVIDHHDHPVPRRKGDDEGDNR